MRPATTSYPPPLSSPPTVEALEGLLAGLRRPLRPGVPAPPVGTGADTLLFGGRPVAPVPLDRQPPSERASGARDAAAGLTWSARADRRRRRGLSPRAVVVATTAAAAAVATAAVATGAV